MTPISFVSAKSPALLSVLVLMAVAATTAAVVTPQYGCTGELREMSPCLPYISSPPNNLSSSASSDCCILFNSAFNTGSVTCLCHFIRQPSLLGFPLNNTRIFSLSSVCPVKNATNQPERISLKHFCEELPPLPPLESTSGSVSENSPSPLACLSSESAASSPAPTSLPADTRTSSSASMLTHSNGCQFLPGLMLFFVPIVAYL
ncbi:Bifunctional inhibitor/plant lipid transfer protein/seed storage helical domain [Macleaya cordata]|uniref:Bifunctional inhibitor/plant lipid transfer protein/seed storage helical domain n=1 Tax=Macleaya cordata TaxID=56857 RepID=A0A200Q4S7_MACCD|nr:Bifunctional inhibitor/plant lipid transfer protein/seed storage helical domain [Macleaya cordata]